MSLSDVGTSHGLSESMMTGISRIDSNFQEIVGTLSKDYAGDWMAALRTENKARISEADEYGEVYLTTETVQFVFTLCIRLRLPTEVRYKAASVFDRFMKIHTRQMFTFLSSLEMDPKRKREEWEKVETNMSRQITLRVCSAIQLASKDVSYHDSLSTKQICSCLRSLGTPYTKGAVLKSEMRMFKTLGYIMPHTPVVYAESILKMISMHKRTSMDVGSVWNFVSILLDVYYMERENIYKIMLDTVLEDPSFVSKVDINRLKCDWIHVGCGLVCAAICCIYGFDEGDPVAVELEEVCETPAKDISELAIAILEVARGNNNILKNREDDSRITPPPAKKNDIHRDYLIDSNELNSSIIGSFPFTVAMHTNVPLLRRRKN